MKATWRGRVIASSEQTLDVGGYRYFPRESVQMALLRGAAKTAEDRLCPHGVQFYDLVDGGETSERAAWSYEAPQGTMKSVDHWVGFWRDVVIDESLAACATSPGARRARSRARGRSAGRGQGSQVAGPMISRSGPA
jgi:uncharacterized protein (DUF427 family)